MKRLRAWLAFAVLFGLFIVAVLIQLDRSVVP